jgi:hypothetical protein
MSIAVNHCNGSIVGTVHITLCHFPESSHTLVTGSDCSGEETIMFALIAQGNVL